MIAWIIRDNGYNRPECRRLMFLLTTILVFNVAACSGPPALRQWHTIEVKGTPTARHEAGFVAYKNTLILLGGRRINPTDVFDVNTNTWSAKEETPIELHHFQPVVMGNAVYIVGAMTGGWPNETPVQNVIVYYPETDTYVTGHPIPESRRRGGAGAVAYQGKIYIVGGIVNGHVDGYKPWFDVYDPVSGEWQVLEDAPNARDHFQAVVANHKLYAIGGRRTSHSTGQDIDLTVAEVDIFNFESNQWETISAPLTLPTERAGNFAITIGNEILIGGGESATQINAHSEVEALNTTNQQWQQWPSLLQGRHGSGFAVIGDYLYTASGCGKRGGEPELESMERIRISP
ncbi:N-acetylneuraminate epimerase [Thalassocella blandensis]|nr:N-acetylneuraminate epimerase [Thalassocella blandensis]